MAGQTAADLASGYVDMGVPADATDALVSLGDPVMASCIMDLYRSAAPALRHLGWGPGPDRRRPAWSCTPPTTASATRRVGRGGGAVGRRPATLTGVGHWWALQDPDQAAAVLTTFHASVG